MQALGGVPLNPSDDAPHLLVVDDDARIRNLLSRFLTAEGYRVSTADNAAEARARLSGLHFDLLILDDFALQPLDTLDTADIYELVVERHRSASTLVTSNREPIEWIGQMADALLAQSAIDRLQSAAYELVLDGESYRKHQKPGLDVGTTTPRAARRKRRP